MEFVLAKNNLLIHEKYLKRAILRHEPALVKSNLNKIILPNKSLLWATFVFGGGCNVNYEILKTIINRKFTLDKLIAVSYGKHMQHIYKTLQDWLDESFCSTIYYANAVCLNNLIAIIKEYNISYKFQPHCNSKHTETFAWLMKNIQQGRNGSYVGWRSGPDSALWPSNNLEDYEECLSLISKYNIVCDC
jgi:hypothetical protein